MSVRTLSVAENLRANSAERGYVVTPMHLIKLAYIAHGYMLAQYDAALLDEDVEAWQYGPVVPNIYRALKAYGNSPVDNQVPGSKPDFSFSNDERAVMRSVVETYGRFRATLLSTATHMNGSPWHAIWNKRGKSSVIPNDLIRSHYLSILKSEKHSAL